MNIIIVLFFVVFALFLVLYTVARVDELSEAKTRLARLEENQKSAEHIAWECYRRLCDNEDSFVRKDDTMVRLRDLLTVYGYYPPDDDSDSSPDGDDCPSGGN
jgi:hypothetical protein